MGLLVNFKSFAISILVLFAGAFGPHSALASGHVQPVPAKDNNSKVQRLVIDIRAESQPLTYYSSPNPRTLLSSIACTEQDRKNNDYLLNQMKQSNPDVLDLIIKLKRKYPDYNLACEYIPDGGLRNGKGFPPTNLLYSASLYCLDDVVDYILQNSNSSLSVTNYYGFNALTAAALNSDKSPTTCHETIKLLLNYQQNSYDFKQANFDGENLLHLASLKSPYNTFEVVINHLKTYYNNSRQDIAGYVNTPTKIGQSALTYALANRFDEEKVFNKVKALVELGADVNQATLPDGNSSYIFNPVYPLHVVVKKTSGYVKVLDYLLAHGADPEAGIGVNFPSNKEMLSLPLYDIAKEWSYIWSNGDLKKLKDAKKSTPPTTPINFDIEMYKKSFEMFTKVLEPMSMKGLTFLNKGIGKTEVGTTVLDQLVYGTVGENPGLPHVSEAIQMIIAKWNKVSAGSDVYKKLFVTDVLASVINSAFNYRVDFANENKGSEYPSLSEYLQNVKKSYKALSPIISMATVSEYKAVTNFFYALTPKEVLEAMISNSSFLNEWVQDLKSKTLKDEPGPSSLAAYKVELAGRISGLHDLIPKAQDLLSLTESLVSGDSSNAGLFQSKAFEITKIGGLRSDTTASINTLLDKVRDDKNLVGKDDVVNALKEQVQVEGSRIQLLQLVQSLFK